MPILEVSLALRDGETVPADLAARIAYAAGQVFNAPPGTVWVTLTPLGADRYAENATAHHDTPRPAFVRLTKAAADAVERRAAEAAALAAALGSVLDRPSSVVHVIYEPPAAGRVAFGGRLVPQEPAQ
jgi:phenylpyruvate tautomerase PptA (4-oxalocrotonate tautomerase family)